MKSGDSVLTSKRALAGMRGEVSVLTHIITTRSCSTLLCLRLCMKDDGATEGSLVRNTAVPGTRTGFDLSSILIRSPIGIESRWVLMVRIALPRDHVHITTNVAEPSSRGTHPPSKILYRLAMKKLTPIARNPQTNASAPHSGQRQSFQTTKKASAVVVTIVPETAMP